MQVPVLIKNENFACVTATKMIQYPCDIFICIFGCNTNSRNRSCLAQGRFLRLSACIFYKCGIPNTFLQRFVSISSDIKWDME